MSSNTNRQTPSLAWLYRTIIIAALIAIAIILIIYNSKPATPESSGNSSQESTQNDPSQPKPSENTDSAAQPTNEQNSKSETAPVHELTPASSSGPEPTPQSTPTTTSEESKCYHEEAGRCLDDIEDAAYSAGIYDHEYGRYGSSLDYPDDCNASCREAIEDAYDEGWYDAH